MLWSGMFDMLNLEKILSIEWIGQTLASLFWIISVFVYQSDISLLGTGDWLQLAAASSWMLSNLASAVKVES